MIRLLIVTNVRLYREGLARRLSALRDVEIVGTAGGRQQALSLAREGADVVLIDVTTPSSLQLIEDLHRELPSTAVVALGLPELETEVIPWVEVGIAGYLPLEGSTEELVQLVHSVERGESLVSPRIAGELIRRVSALAAREMSVEGLVRLTRREREIAALLEEGLSNKEISRRLGIRLATVKNHVHSILNKLHLHRRGQVAARFSAERRGGYRRRRLSQRR